LKQNNFNLFLYFSVSDAEAKVTTELKGVSEEKALKSLLESDEDSDDKNGENKTVDNNFKTDFKNDTGT